MSIVVHGCIVADGVEFRPDGTWAIINGRAEIVLTRLPEVVRDLGLVFWQAHISSVDTPSVELTSPSGEVKDLGTVILDQHTGFEARPYLHRCEPVKFEETGVYRVDVYVKDEFAAEMSEEAGDTGSHADQVRLFSGPLHVTLKRGPNAEDRWSLDI